MFVTLKKTVVKKPISDASAAMFISLVNDPEKRKDMYSHTITNEIVHRFQVNYEIFEIPSPRVTYKEAQE